MKTGIIIIFHNFETELDRQLYVDHFNKAEHVEVCLVNNNSQDNTLEHLLEISESCKNVSVLNINKFKSDINAIRAGARYLVNQFNLRELAYIDTHAFNSDKHKLNSTLNIIFKNLPLVIHYKDQVSQQKKIKQSMFQTIISLLDCLKVFEREGQNLALQGEVS